MGKISRNFILIFSCFLAGCSWFGARKTVESPSTVFVDSGKIIDSQKLIRGKSVLVIPFKAGVDVEATDELDRTALMIVSGLADVFTENNSPLTIVVSEQAKEADFIMKGYIVELGKAGGLKKWVLRNKKKHISVEGQLIDRKTKKVILHFSRHRETKKQGVSHNDLARMIGEDIARFILSGVN